MFWALAKGLASWEIYWWRHRATARVKVMLDAALRAKEVGRPLLVVGAPDHGMTGGYPCGDLTTDNLPASSCPNFQPFDLSSGQQLPVADNSVVVYVSCVLEYVPDLNIALAELERVSGGELYITRVEPWTLTAAFYPGAKRTLPWPSGKFPNPNADPNAPAALPPGQTSTGNATADQIIAQLGDASPTPAAAVSPLLLLAGAFLGYKLLKR